jgi:hypothetical protein
MPDARMKHSWVVHKSTAGSLKPIPEAVDLVGNPPTGLTSTQSLCSSNEALRTTWCSFAQRAPRVVCIAPPNLSKPGFPLSKWTTNLVKLCKAPNRRGVGRGPGCAEVEWRWVRQKIGPFSCRSIAH